MKYRIILDNNKQYVAQCESDGGMWFMIDSYHSIEGAKEGIKQHQKINDESKVEVVWESEEVAA